MPLRILLADDAPAVRQSVKGLLEGEGFEVVGEAPDGQEAVTLAREVRPDVAILDLSMPRLNGLDAAREIRHVCPWTHLILLTVHSEEHQVVRAFLNGVRGYVAKPKAAEDLAQAIEEVSRGGTFLSPSLPRINIQAYLAGTDCPLRPDRPGAKCEVCGFCPASAAP